MNDSPPLEVMDTEEAAWRRILAAEPGHVEANRGLGHLLLTRGEPHDAFPLLLEVLKAEPQEPANWLAIQKALIDARLYEAAQGLVGQAKANGMGEATLEAMRRQVLEGASGMLAVQAPNAPRAAAPAPAASPKAVPRHAGGPAQQRALTLLARGDQALGAGRRQAAEKAYRDAVATWPGCDLAWNNLGKLLFDAGRADEAETAWGQAIAASPTTARYHHNLAVLLKRACRLEEAAQVARRAIELDPSFAETHLLLASCLLEQGEARRAEPAFRSVLALQPTEPNALAGLGTSLWRLSRPAEAEAAFRAAIAARPGDVSTLRHLGRVLVQQNRLPEAEELLREALRSGPQGCLAAEDLVSLLQLGGRAQEAEQCLREAMEQHPDAAVLWHQLGLFLANNGRVREAIETVRGGLSLAGDVLALRKLLMFCLLYDDAAPPDEVLREALALGSAMEAAVTPMMHRPRPGDAGRRPRLGFVSGDLRNHAVTHFLLPAWEALRRRGFEIFAYSNNPRHEEDGISRRFQETAAGWRRITDLDDAAAARLVREDGIDILFDLSGFTKYNRLPMFALKPAPVQVSWIGNPGTTGLTRMDYFIADDILARPGVVDAQMTEKLARLPVAIAFDPLRSEPAVAPLPALNRGHVTFGCLNRPTKVTDSMVALWARILHRVPDSRLLIGALIDERARSRLSDEFAAHGIAPERLILRPRVGFDAFLAQFNEIDIQLDTFPYTGGTTTCWAMWMGVPTVTLAGQTMQSCQSAMLMSQIGLGDFVASSEEEYLGHAMFWAQHTQRLAALREGMRGRVAAGLTDATRLAAGLDAALHRMWARWCAGEAPESFSLGAAEIGE
jgi:predicted O-linked N-acetylglucosamine transferase (SPINDLY family)